MWHTQQLRFAGVCAFLLLGLTLPMTWAAPPATHGRLIDRVNPMIGTGGDPDDGIDIFPGAVAPFGMVQLSPDTEDHGFGYHSIQRWIKGFSMTHMSGAGCANEGDVFFTATTGPVSAQGNDFQSPYSHRLERAEPGYYAVHLLQWDIEAELTATERTGVARFRFPADKPANILLPISHTLNQTEGAHVRIVDNQRIEGYVENHPFCNKPGTYRVYFVMRFDRPFSTYGTWSGDRYGGPAVLNPRGRSAQQAAHEGWTGAWATWPEARTPQVLTAKIGISYVDMAGAERNLEAEAAGRSFDETRRGTQAAWEQELQRIEVAGGTSVQQRVFYTALYHSLLMPSLFSDADGRYTGFDHQVHTAAQGRSAYTNFSGWDIYRSEIPLLALIEPRRLQDMAQSVVLMYQQGGWIDRWPQINLYTNDMIGSPLTIALATAWLNGLHGFDMEAAWRGMLEDATEAPPAGKPYLGEEGIEWMNRLHYLPADKVEYGSVAKTLEYALAYASLARVAASLHKDKEAAMLRDRALAHRNLFDPASGFFRPRRADGTWMPDFNPAADGQGFVEGTAWHYLFFAPADMGWVVKTMGRERFNQQLSELFAYPLPGWYAQFYNPYNETDFQAPYAFHFSGQPWKSQQVVRRILNENYLDTPDGVPGNDDGGATSSWAVLSMMGLYTVDPTSLAYELNAPVFSRVVVHLAPPYPAHAFTIETSGGNPSHGYIHSVSLNGKTHTENWISFDAMRNGSTVSMVLADAPDPSWGTHPEDAPPALSHHP